MTMAKKNYTRFNINNVEAMYPRLDKPYSFNSMQNKSVPCDVFDDGAAYEVNFNMTKEQAADLYKNMVSAWNEGKEASWADKFDMPFKKLDDGRFQGKSKLKAAYGKNATRTPAQYDAKSIKLDDDFQLTSGSTVNINVELVPYSMTSSAGVSLRLRAIQVVALSEMAESNPFGEVDGYSSATEDDNPFGEATPEVVAEVEDVPVPKTTKSRKKKPTVEKEGSELDDILSQFDEVDD